VQKGNYNGWWLRVHAGFSGHELKDAIAALEAKATSAVYVTFAEHMFSGPKYLPILESLGYQFHHYLKHEFVYYRWIDPTRHDMVFFSPLHPIFLWGLTGTKLCYEY